MERSAIPLTTAVNKSSVWVRMLEGPENGNSVKRAFKQVRLPSQAVAPATVALAGTVPVEETSAASRKRGSGESRVFAIFKKAKIGDDDDDEYFLK